MGSRKQETRRDLVEGVAASVGAFRTAADIVDEAMAAAFAVNRTDLRLIQALQVQGPLAAGDLGRAVGLSPGATTTAIDRLVAAGHATRERRSEDRRRVTVALTPSAAKTGERAFGVMVEAGRGILDRYTREQLLLIRDFMERARQVEMTQVEELRALAQRPRETKVSATPTASAAARPR